MSFYSWLRNLLSVEHSIDGNRLRCKDNYVQLSLTRLEDRRVLDASFSFVAGQLDLDSFNNTGGTSSVDVTDAGITHDFGNGAGAESAYRFQLDAGAWTTQGIQNLNGDATNDVDAVGGVLFVSKNFLLGNSLRIDASLLANSTIEVNNAVNFTGLTNVDFAAAEIDLNATIEGNSTLLLRPTSGATSILIGGGSDTGLNVLDITDGDINNIGAGWNKIAIGAPIMGSEAITIDSTGALFANNLILNSSGMGGEVHIDGLLQNSGTITINGSNATTILNANIVTSGTAVIINDSVLVDSDRTIDTTNGGGSAAGANVTITGAIDGLNVLGTDNLTITAGSTGDVDLQSDVVGQTGTQLVPLGEDLQNLTITADEINLKNVTVLGEIDLTANDIDLMGSNYIATNGITFNGAVDLLAATATVESTASGNITFNGTLNGAQILTVNTAGTTAFNFDVGTTTALTRLTTDAGGSTVFGNNVTISTFDHQNYHDAVILTSGTVTFIDTSLGNAINFMNTVDAASAGSASLATQTGTGRTTFDQAVGDNAELLNLTVNNTPFGQITLGGNVSTTGNQTYNGVTRLNSTVTVASSSSGNITFIKSIISNPDGAFGLTVNTAGNTSFDKVGSNLGNRLSFLTTDAAGTTTINDDIFTTGNQTYHDTVTLNINRTLTSAAGNITSNGTMTAAALSTTTFSAIAGDVTLNNAGNDFATVIVNAQNVILSDTNEIVLGTSTITNNLTVNTTGNVTDVAASMLTVGGIATFNVGANDVVLDEVNNNFGTVAVTAANSAEFKDINGIVLGASNIGGTFDVTTGGHITQSGPLLVGGIATFTTPNGFNITLNNTANDFHQVNLFDDDATIVDVNGILVGDTNISGTLSVTAGTFIDVVGDVQANVVNFDASAGAGDITDTGGSLTVTTISTFNVQATDDIILDNSANDFNSISVTQAKNVTINDANNLSVTGVNNPAGTTQFDVTMGTVTQTGAIASNELLLLGGTDYTLTNTTNNVGTLAASTTGSINYRNQSTLAVGSVNGTNGITTAGGDVTVLSDDSLNVNQAIDSGDGGAMNGGNVSLTATNNLNLNAIVSTAMGAGGTLNISGLTIASGFSPVVGAGNLTLAGGELDTIINTPLANTGGMTITAPRHVLFGVNGDLNSNSSDINITADTLAGNNGGTITMSDGTLFNAGGGNVTGVADGDVTVGQITGATIVDLTSANGAIVDAGDVGGADIVATSAALRAKNGIGSGDPLETDISTLAAINSDMGNTEIDNIGATPLAIGTVNGLDGVTNNSVNTNSIVISSTSAINVKKSIVNATGNITLTTINNSDLTTNALVTVTGGTGSVLLNVSKDLIVNDSTDASGNDLHVGGTGTFTANVADNTQLNANTKVSTADQQIIFNTDDIAIDPTAEINSGTERTIIRPMTTGGIVSVDLGSNPGSANVLELSDSELDRITASVLEIGSTETKAITVTDAISPANVNTLHLISGSTVNATAAGTITETNLAIEADTGVNLANNNNVDTLAVNITGATGGLTFKDVNALTIGTVDVVTGVTTNNGNAKLTTGGLLTIDDDVNVGAATFTIDTAAGATQNATKDITAKNLELIGTGPFTLSNMGNMVDVLAANIIGTLSYQDTDDLEIGISGTTTGVTTTDNLNVTVGNNLDIQEAIATNSGDATLNAQGNISVNSNITTDGGIFNANADTNGNTTGTFDINAVGSVTTNNANANVTAADVNFAGAFDVGTETLTLQTSTPATVIGLGGGAAALFTLDDADADNITANTVVVGDATQTGGIEIHGQLTADGHYAKLNLISNSTLTDKTATEQTDMTVDHFSISTAGGIGAAGDDDIDIKVDTLTTSTIDTDQFIEEEDDLSAINLMAGKGVIHLTTGGAIQDTDVDDDIVASGAVLKSATGIGTAFNPIQTTVTNLEADGGNGGLFITNNGALIIGGLGGALGATVTAGDIDISASGSLTVEDKVLNSGTGNVNLTTTKSGDITLQDQVEAQGATATVHLNAAGGIIDDHAATTDVVATNIALESNSGIGSNDTLETASDVISADNKVKGDINIANGNGGGLLTIGQVATLPSGIRNNDGAINVSHSGDLMVDTGAEVITPAKSDITLKADGGGKIDLFGLVSSAGGNILFEADDALNFNDTGEMFDVSTTGGTIIGTHNGTVTIGNDVLLRTNSGTLATVDPVIDVQMPIDLVSPIGDATLNTTFGSPGETSFVVVVDWFHSAGEQGNGLGAVAPDQFAETSAFAGPTTPPSTTPFNFNYLTHPDPANAADDIPVAIYVVRSATLDGSIQIGQTDLLIPLEVGIPVPGEGFGIGQPAPLPEVPLLVFPQPSGSGQTDVSQVTTFFGSETVDYEKTTEEVTTITERVVLLRVISPTGKVIEDVPLTPESLDNLPALYKKLFDGRYQIIVKEASANPESQKERIVADVKIRNGQVADEKNATERPPSTESTTPQNNRKKETKPAETNKTPQSTQNQIKPADSQKENVSANENQHDLFWSNWGTQPLDKKMSLKNESPLLQVSADHAQALSAGALMLAVVRSQKPKTLEQIDKAMERYRRKPR